MQENDVDDLAAVRRFLLEEGSSPEERSPLIMRWTATALLFGQEALDYDQTPEATALLNDNAVAELLYKTGNPACYKEYLAQFRSQITAFAQRREIDSRRWAKEKAWPDERILRAMGILRSTIPLRLEELQEELEGLPEHEYPDRRREVTRLERLLLAVREDSHVPLEKDLEQPIRVASVVAAFAETYDRAYGPSRAWAGSPKVRFIAAAVARAGFGDRTPAAIEQQLLRLSKKRSRIPTKA